MKKITFILLILISFGIPFSAIAKPEEKILNELNSEVLRVEVNHQNGSKGLGSGVVIASSQVATNCHVVTDAKDIRVVFNNIRYLHVTHISHFSFQWINANVLTVCTC